MATRCISPPLRLLTGSSARSARPTRSNNSSTRGSKSRCFPPATSAGTARFSRTGRWDRRWKNWKTSPISFLRNRVRSRSE